MVEDLKLKKEERIKQFTEIKAQIDKISVEISGYSHLVTSGSSINLEEQDLSLRNLTEYQTHLRALQREKVCTRSHNSIVTVIVNLFIDLMHRLDVVVDGCHIGFLPSRLLMNNRLRYFSTRVESCL